MPAVRRLLPPLAGKLSPNKLAWERKGHVASASEKAAVVQVEAPRPVKKVRFADVDDEVHETFTPYAQVYGIHPSGFVFDGEGNMVPHLPPGKAFSDLESVYIGHTIMCTVGCGVGYRKSPLFNARFDDLTTLNFGEHIVVQDRCGEWVQDEKGWLPLFIGGRPVFGVLAAPGASSNGDRGLLALEGPHGDLSELGVL